MNMTKRLLTIMLAVSLCLAFAWALSVAEGAKRSCQYCGMDLDKFAHTAMTIKYDDGTTVETCSIHCAAVDFALNIDKTPSSIMVGDFSTRQRIDAEAAFWVIDPKNPGVMTGRAKWAFKDKAEAEKYVKEKMGEVVSFDAAMKAAYEDMYADTRMIREMRKMRMQHGGGMQHGDMPQGHDMGGMKH